MELRLFASAALAIAGCLIADLASAQVISKCPDGRGGFVYQDTPCPNGRSAKDWDASVHQLSPERQRQVDAERRHRELLAASRSPSNVNNVVFNNSSSASQQQTSRCNAAKAHRQRELERLDLRRTYDTLRSLNDYVTRECSRR